VKVIDEVQKERDNQDTKWGEQNHCPKVWALILGEEVGEVSKELLDAGEFVNGKFQVKDTTEYRKELIQVAAVAIAAVEALDRGKWK
jgi:NTP pyrophosphatase (non-canonical NTP hydrolase)